MKNDLFDTSPQPWEKDTLVLVVIGILVLGLIFAGVI